MGKDENSLKIKDTMQEGRGETNTSYQGNLDGASRMLVKGEVRRGWQKIRTAERVAQKMEW